MSEWAGNIATTITHYFRGDVDETMRKRILLAMLNDRGRMLFNLSGINVQWQTRFQQMPMSGFDDSDTITFSRINRHKDAVLPWRGYDGASAVGERDRRINNGMEAIVKVFSNQATWMAEDMTEQLGNELYVDGNAANNQKRFHGLDSFLGYSGTVSGSKVGNPNSTYAGLNCGLGSYGGAWSGNWPQGSGPTLYDFFSPTIVDYTNALWPQATKTWQNTCIDAMRYGLIASKKNKSRKTQVDIVVLDWELYRQFVTLLQAEERLHVSPENGSSGMWKLGFTDIQNFDGVDITWEYGIPQNVGYGLAMNAVELMCLTGELIEPKGPVFDESSQQWRFWATILANLKFESPRHFVKFAAIT